MYIYNVYLLSFILMLYRSPVDNSPVTEGVTLFKHQLLLPRKLIESAPDVIFCRVLISLNILHLKLVSTTPATYFVLSLKCQNWMLGSSNLLHVFIRVCSIYFCFSQDKWCLIFCPNTISHARENVRLSQSPFLSDFVDQKDNLGQV